jgi:hypothetical protein
VNMSCHEHGTKVMNMTITIMRALRAPATKVIVTFTSHARSLARALCVQPRRRGAQTPHKCKDPERSDDRY